MVTRTFFFEIL
jgi:hypothetical protein